MFWPGHTPKKIKNKKEPWHFNKHLGCDYNSSKTPESADASKAAGFVDLKIVDL